MMYSTTLQESCPIANTLGGTWVLITEGKFLVAASSDTSSPYTFAKTVGFEDTQLKAHTHELERNSDFKSGVNTTTKVTTANAGEHKHNFSITARAHDASTDTGLRSGNPNGGCHQ